MARISPKWLQEYRDSQFKVKHISKEKIIRSSILVVFKEYVCNCSLPGFGYLVNPNVGKKERCCWVIILLAIAAMLGFSIHSTWTNVLGRPLIVSMESSVYPIESIDFPAVAICNVNRVSKRAATEIAKRALHRMLPDYELETLVNIIEHFGRLIDFESDGSQEFQSFISHIPTEYISDIDIVELMKKLAPSCEKMLVRCTWAGKIIPCEDLFTVRRTSHGHCCAFNYVMDFNKLGRPVRTISETKSQVVSGSYYGLNILLDPELDDYAYPLHNIEGFDILLFDSTHYADHNNGHMIHRMVAPNTGVYLELHSRQQLATDEVRKYSVDTRKCLFSNERRKDFDKMYSYSSCIISCRIKTVQSLCKCTPYFLPVPRNESPVCTFTDLQCLNKYKEKFIYLYPKDPVTTDGLEVEIQDSLSCPECLPDCEYTRHYTKSSTVVIVDSVMDGLQYEIIAGINITNMCFISIYHPTSDGVLDRLDVVYYWFELLSNFGGAAGLLVGYSIVSSVEILYYFTVRLYKIIKEKMYENPE